MAASEVGTHLQSASCPTFTVSDFTAPFQIFQEMWKYSSTKFSTDDALSFVFRRLLIVSYESGRKEKLFRTMACGKITALLKGKLKLYCIKRH